MKIEQSAFASDREHASRPRIGMMVRRPWRSPLFEEADMVRKGLGLALVAAALMVSACNTVAGAGKDVSSAGKAVTNAAQ
ncbi:entericidin A/B family lipoprotein [Sphingomonas bacterium]|uniref:entericidin A/B family lipoprotein n=1 Tax=Sphingomonas bacterium TaxID=1895847 RepID=UPI003F68B190